MNIIAFVGAGIIGAVLSSVLKSTSLNSASI